MLYDSLEYRLLTVNTSSFERCVFACLWYLMMAPQDVSSSWVVCSPSMQCTATYYSSDIEQIIAYRSSCDGDRDLRVARPITRLLLFEKNIDYYRRLLPCYFFAFISFQCHYFMVRSVNRLQDEISQLFVCHLSFASRHADLFRNIVFTKKHNVKPTF